MNRIFILLLSIFLIQSNNSFAQGDPFDQINEFKKAISENQGYNSIESVVMTYTTKANNTTLKGKIYLSCNNTMKITLDIDGQTNFMYIDNNEGWTFLPAQGQTKITKMKDEMFEKMRNELNLYSLIYKVNLNSPEIEPMGQTIIDEKISNSVKINNPYRPESSNFIFFSSETKLIVKIDQEIDTEEGRKTLSTYFNDYKKVGDYLIPTSVKNEYEETVYSDIKLNVDDIYDYLDLDKLKDQIREESEPEIEK